jgi:hypothetical protein
VLDLLPIELTAALIALIPGLGTVYLARKLNRLQESRNLQDARVAAAGYKLALFQMRVEVYMAVQRYVSDFVTEGRPTIESAVKLRRHDHNARFLFPAEVQAFVAELARTAFDYQRAYLIQEPLRAHARSGAALSPQERAAYDEQAARMRDIEAWLTEVWETGRYLAVFEPFLTLPEALPGDPDLALATVGGVSRDHATHARVNALRPL